MGSASELEYHILLAYDLNLMNQTNYKQLTKDATEIKRMLASLIKRLKAER